MLKRIIPRHISLLLFCLGIGQNTVAANRAPKHIIEQQPIEIYATTVEFEDKKNTATYKGSVIMKQDNHHLTADTLIILKDNKGKVESMVATGNPAHFHTEMQPTKPKLIGHAKIIEFYPKQDKILLLKNAELTQNNETIRGESLTYFLSTHILSAHPVSGEKTTIILGPTATVPTVKTGNNIP